MLTYVSKTIEQTSLCSWIHLRNSTHSQKLLNINYSDAEFSDKQHHILLSEEGSFPKVSWARMILSYIKTDRHQTSLNIDPHYIQHNIYFRCQVLTPHFTELEHIENLLPIIPSNLFSKNDITQLTVVAWKEVKLWFSISRIAMSGTARGPLVYSV